VDEAAGLRDDVAELRALIDTLLDRDGDGDLLDACADVLRERLERLERSRPTAPAEASRSLFLSDSTGWAVDATPGGLATRPSGCGSPRLPREAWACVRRNSCVPLPAE
jgi:hypothetical protein